MSDDSSNKSGGVTTLGLLLVLFVGLKLTNFINWSWFWVLTPLWGPFALVLVIVLMYWTYLLIKGDK